MYGDGCNIVEFLETRAAFHVMIGRLLTVDRAAC
jgi:hypothetical protein